VLVQSFAKRRGSATSFELTQEGYRAFAKKQQNVLTRFNSILAETSL
jgi:hypothetical protein